MGAIEITYIFFYIPLILIWGIYRGISIKKNKERNFKGEILLNIFFFYLLTVFYITIFKMGRITLNFEFSSFFNLVPIIETIKMFGNSSLSLVLYNILGNILLFIPLGFLVPVLFPKFNKWYKVLLIGMSLSAFIEFIQYFTTNNFTDIDDLIFNTLGSILGYTLLKIFIKILESIRLSKLINKFNFVTSPKEKIYLRRSLGTMILVGAGVIIFSYYNQTYSINITDEEAEVAVFSKYSRSNVVLSKEILDSKFYLVNNDGYYDLNELSKISDKRYVKEGSSAQFTLDKQKYGFVISTAREDYYDFLPIIAGKNKDATKVVIDFMGEKYEEELLKEDFFMVSYPKLKHVKDESDFYKALNGEKANDLKITFFNKDGTVNEEMKVFKN